MDPLFDFFAQLSATARSTFNEAIGRGLDTENKGGFDHHGGSLYDPVTQVDRAVERALRSSIEERFPDDGIVGEEYGAVREQARRAWSLDPIDGTRQLVCGLPTWTVLVGLVESGIPLAGMIDTPRLDELIIGQASGTLLIDAEGTSELATSGVTTMAEARLSTTDPYLFDSDAAPRFDRLRQAAMLTRFGLDGYAYGRLAAGTIDLVAETGLKPHDWQALVPVVRGAGGVIGNWRGGEDTSGGDVLAAATRPLFDQAIRLLAG
jgi:histidinol phosphatase-like enzyme (inositol monophosphatase family)